MCVGLALLFAMMISGLTGATIPTVFYRAGIDPAVASGPLITTVNDLVAVVSYYGLAWFFLLQLNLIA
jgi:magnesium transporter